MTDHNEQQRQRSIYKIAILHFLYEKFGDGDGSITVDYDINNNETTLIGPTNFDDVSYGVKSKAMFDYIRTISPDVNTSDFLHSHAGDDISKAIVEVIGDQWNRIIELAKEVDKKLPAH